MAQGQPPPNRSKEPPDGSFGPSDLARFVPELADLTNKLLGLGAKVTRTMIRAAEPGPAGTGNGSLDEMVRNGATVVANVVRLTVEGLRAGTRPPSGTDQAATDQRATQRPSVHAGDKLRMPLFIENPSAESTGPLRFGALEATSFDSNGGRSLDLAQVRCAPETLEIGARDFEKLTVFIDTEPTTPLGHHWVQVGVPGTAFVTSVEFDVLAAPD